MGTVVKNVEWNSCAKYVHHQISNKRDKFIQPFSCRESEEYSHINQVTRLTYSSFLSTLFYKDRSEGYEMAMFYVKRLSQRVLDLHFQITANGFDISKGKEGILKS